MVGENGITERTVKASKTHNIAGTKEKLELQVADYAEDFYQAKYMDGSSEASGTVGSYILGKFKNDSDFEEDYTLTKQGNEITITNKNDENQSATATIDENGKVSWSGTATEAVATGTQDGTSVTNGEVTLTVGQAVTGYSVDVEINDVTQTISNWYVLGAKNGELLITTNTSYENVTLSGIEDYVGGVAKLNNAASKYSDGDMANSTRTIDMEDINRITGYNPEVDGSNVGRIDEYGKEVTFTLKDDGFVWYKETGKTTEEGCLNDTKFEYWNGISYIRNRRK